MPITFGDLSRGDDGFDLTFERVLATSVEDAWSAVTDPERLARWMEPYAGELRLGGTWQGLNSDGSVFVEGTVSECEPPHRFVTSWHAVEEGPTTLTVTVAPHQDGALLRLHHVALPSVFYGAGWQTYLEQLDDEVGAAPSSMADPDRRPGAPWDDRFTELRPAWQARFDALEP